MRIFNNCNKIRIPPPNTCVPMTIAPWSPGAKKLKVLGGTAALLEKDTNTCLWAGKIEITDPGQKEMTAT